MLINHPQGVLLRASNDIHIQLFFIYQQLEIKLLPMSSVLENQLLLSDNK